jgi:hypothetical protein
MAGQLGYRSKFYRGATQIAYARTITPPEPSRDRVDSTHLESADFVRESVAGFIDYPEMTVECIAVDGNAAQEQLEQDFYDGTAAPETWSYQVCDNDTGVTQRTYTFQGYISGALRGPISTEELLLLTIKIQLTSSVAIT